MPATNGPLSDVQTACRLAGWEFDRLLEARIFGQRVFLAVRIDHDEVARRSAAGRPGALAPYELERLHATKEAPTPITQLVGVCVLRSDANQGVKSAALFAGFAPRIVVAREVDVTADVLTSAIVFDVGLASCDEGVCRLLEQPGPKVGGALSLHERALREWAYSAPDQELASFVTN